MIMCKDSKCRIKSDMRCCSGCAEYSTCTDRCSMWKDQDGCAHEQYPEGGYNVRRVVFETCFVKADNRQEAAKAFCTADKTTEEVFFTKHVKNVDAITIDQAYSLTPIELAANTNNMGVNFLIETVMNRIISVPGVLDAIMEQIPNDWVYSGIFDRDITKMSLVKEWVFKNILSGEYF